MAITDNNNGLSNRAIILESALDEFSAHGFSGARVSTIAKRAGLNSRMVYHYFGNKEGLYRAALAQVLETAQQAIAQLPVIRMTIDRETLFELHSRLYNAIFSQPRAARLMVAECFDGGKRLKELKNERPDLFEPTLGKAVELFRALTGSHREPDDNDPILLLGLGGLVSFLVAGYDTANLFLGKDMNSPKRWEQVIRNLLLGVMAEEEEQEGIPAQADISSFS